MVINISGYSFLTKKLSAFNEYIAANVSPQIYAKLKNIPLGPTAKYWHNHGGLMRTLNAQKWSVSQTRKWSHYELADRYIMAFLKFKDRDLEGLIEETIENKTGQEPTAAECYLGQCLFEIFPEVICGPDLKLILNALRVLFCYRDESFWVRHYMERDHSMATHYPEHNILPGPVGLPGIVTDSNVGWSVEVDRSPFTYSMLNVNATTPIGILPLARLKNYNPVFRMSYPYCREHPIIQTDRIPLTEWIFLHKQQVNVHWFAKTGGLIDVSLAKSIMEVTDKLIAHVRALKEDFTVQSEMKDGVTEFM